MSTVAVETAGRLLRYAVREAPAELSDLTPSGLGDGRLVVTDDGGGVAAALVERLAARGVDAAVTREVPPDADGVVFLGGLREVAGLAEAIAVNHEAFAAARAVAARFTRSGGLFAFVQDTGGDFGLGGRQGDRAWLGGPAALARTVAKEWPEATVKAIDCERGGRDPGPIADALADELCHGGALPDVGLHADGRRTTLVVEAERTPAPVARWRTGSGRTPVVDRESVVVAAGGARGITAEAVRAIADAHRPRIVLIGRTPLTGEPPPVREAGDETAVKHAIVADRLRAGGPVPAPAEVGALARRIVAAREVRRTMAALTEAGSEVRYLAVDVGDPAALGAALSRVRREWGPVTGLVHGAGVLADKPVAAKTDEMFDRVFDVKVRGLRALLAATAEDPLSFVYLFSSVAAQFGNVGQGDYAMANEVLFQVAAAESARRPGCPVTAVGWGPWRAGMVTAELAGHFRDSGVGLVPVEAGGRAVVATLAAGTLGRRLLVAADGGRILPGPGRRRKTALRFGFAEQPALRDHTIGGTAVVPVALTLDRFLAAARELEPARRDLALADVRVFRPLTVTPGRVRRLTLRAVEDGTGGAELKITDEDGRPCQAARTTAVAGERYADWSPLPAQPPGNADPYASAALFHGPLFRTLKSVESLSAEGADGTVTGVRERGWPGRYPGTDPAAVDAAFQLGVLWAERVLGVATLPMAVKAVRLLVRGALTGPLRCAVRGRHTGPDHAVCDVALLDPGGRTHLELLGVSLIRRP
ncbi:SDR family NAD(P)-dependent oxidoreductase [Amycolatopsis sp. NPDC051102]|uniref:SDR family NAD(P)-dependent oxidoreductase n=1 Tax=Amycolatopsis sp. NPDC051102 TaxID=3155163 RepID=UPI0034120BBD